MVKPLPVKPGSLAEIIELLGFDRAYTVISDEAGIITVMFEGDYSPTVIDLTGEKPEIKGG